MRKRQRKTSGKKSDSSDSSKDISRDIFVGNIPKAATKRDLIKGLSMFGKILDLYMYDKKPGRHDFPKFAFVNFDSRAAVEAAIKSDGDIEILGNQIHIEKRKPKNQVDVEFEPIDPFWHDLLVKFDWRSSACIYMHREMQMEDYLADYIHISASAREEGREKLHHLVERFMNLFETKPASLQESPPAHLSGMVQNYKGDNTEERFRDIIENAPGLFKLEGDEIEYLSQKSKDEARNRLNELIVEGLFLYFLARFTHGAIFQIKYSYYAKSEPIKSILLGLTGQLSVNVAIQYYFNMMKDIFVFDVPKHELKLVEDYFNPGFRRELRQHYHANSVIPVRQLFNVKGVITYVDEKQANIQFALDDNNNCTNDDEDEAAQLAFLDRKDFKCRACLSHGDILYFNATLDLREHKWRCTAAWIPGLALYDMKGKIDGGVIRFTSPDGTAQVAYFEPDFFFTSKEENMNFVNFDTQITDQGFQVSLLWAESQSRPTSDDITNLRMQIKLEKLLEKKPKARNTKYNDKAMLELPANIQSVLSAIHMDDDDIIDEKEMHLSNFDVIDLLLNNLKEKVTGNFHLDPSIIKNAYEKEARKTLCRMVTSLIKQGK